MTRNVTLFLVAALVATVAFLAPLPSLGTGGGAPRVPLDKVGHVAILAVLGLLAARAWPGRRGAAYAGLVLYAVAVEGVQALTPWRSADLWDALAGAVGALLVFVPWPRKP